MFRFRPIVSVLILVALALLAVAILVYSIQDSPRSVSMSDNLATSTAIAHLVSPVAMGP